MKLFQSPEAGLNVPTHMVQLFHAFDRELEPVQVRNQNFPLFLAGVSIIDVEFHDTACDIAELSEIPSVIYRITGIN